MIRRTVFLKHPIASLDLRYRDKEEVIYRYFMSSSPLCKIMYKIIMYSVE